MLRGGDGSGDAEGGAVREGGRASRWEEAWGGGKDCKLGAMPHREAGIRSVAVLARALEI